MKFAKYAALSAALMLPGVALGQTLPSPTFNLQSSSGSFVGGANAGMRAGGASRTWVGLSDGGYNTYLDTTSTTATYSTTGQLGIVGASRLSDGPANAAVGVVGYGNADDTSGSGYAWGGYFKGVRRAGSTAGSVLAVELNSANVGAVVPASPYSMAPTGVTAGLWIGVGGETAQSGITVNPSSMAIGVITNANGQAGGVWGRGIVFQSGSLQVASGRASAITMANGMEMNWNYDGSGSRGGYVRSDATGAAMGLVITNSGVEFHNSSDSNQATMSPTGVLSLYASGSTLNVSDTATISSKLVVGGGGATWTSGTGAPSSTQPVGSMYSRTDGSVGTTLYISRGAGVWNPVAGV